MEEWKEYKIGNICSNVCSGGTPSSKHAEYYDGDIPWLNTKEINFNRIYNTEKCITEEGLNNSSAKWIAENSVIVAMYGATAGKTAIAKIPLTTNQACCNLTIDATIADYRFVYYFLCYKFVELSSLANGGAQQNLNAQIIKDFDIVLPSLKEQTNIANLLSALDDKFEVNRRINDNLEQQAQALFKSWFVDFEPFRDQPFVESELGMIPEGWRVGTLFDVAEIFDKQRKPLSGKEREGMKRLYPYYGATSCMDYVDNYLFDGIYTLIGEDGSVAKEDGSPYMQYVWGKFWVNNHAHILQGKNGFSTEMIYVLLSTTNIQHLVTGAVQAKLSQANMQKIVLAIPPTNVLNQVRPVIDSMYETRRERENESRRLAELRDTLLPRLMSGELSVDGLKGQFAVSPGQHPGAKATSPGQHPGA